MGTNQGPIPGQPGHVGVTARNNQRFVEAVLYRYQVGSAWRDLPQRLGHWKAVHTRLSRWAARHMEKVVQGFILEQIPFS